MHESKVSKYAGGLTGLSPRNNIVASKNRSNISSTYPRNNYLSRSFRSRGDPLSFVSPTINSRGHDTQILPFSNLRIADDDLSHRQRKMIESNPPRDSLASQEIAVEGVR